jgi:hypothetical protein
MKKGLFALLGIVIMTFCLIIGCASSIGNIQRETALNIGGGVHPDSVEVTNVSRMPLETRWDAKANGKRYNCFADDMMRKVNCIPAQKK